MELGLCQVRNVRLDQHSGLALTHERRCGGDDSFSPRNLHPVEEDGCEFADGPLQPAPVVEKLDERNEEDDGWDDAQEEVVKLEEIGAEQERGTLSCEIEKADREESDEVENIIL